MLTIVSICWFNGTGVSSAHATYEGMQVYRQMAQIQQQDSQGAKQEMPPGPPKAVAVFAADNTVRSVFDPDHSAAQWSEFDRGGHFPAMEAPDLLVNDLRSFLRTRR
jgi:hypothetical protein